MQVVVNNLLTSYAKTGNNPKTIILIHGWADTHKSFDDLQVTLSSNYKVISLDLPGSGGTDFPPTTWDLDDFIDFIAAFLDKIEESSPYAIIGHSNGGAIAIRGLATKHLQTQKLILLASAGIRARQKGRKTALKVLAKTGKTASGILPATLRQRLRVRLYKAAGSDMLVSPHMQETFKKIVNQDILEDAKRLMLPTLLLYGDGDVDTPPEYGASLHDAIQGSRLEIIQQAGHHLHRDQPEQITRLIERFLE